MTGPNYRIGDAERDAAIEQLREHHAAGRLDVAEFDERMGKALQARFSDDLRILFTDLPTSWDGIPIGQPQTAVPSSELAPLAADGTVAQPAKQRSTLEKIALGLNGSLFPLVLIIQFATGFDHWWLWLVPMAVAPLLLSLAGEDDD